MSATNFSIGISGDRFQLISGFAHNMKPWCIFTKLIQICIWIIRKNNVQFWLRMKKKYQILNFFCVSMQKSWHFCIMFHLYLFILNWKEQFSLILNLARLQCKMKVALSHFFLTWSSDLPTTGSVYRPSPTWCSPYHLQRFYVSSFQGSKCISA